MSLRGFRIYINFNAIVHCYGVTQSDNIIIQLLNTVTLYSCVDIDIFH